ncbi:hypothetical protein E2C01_033031 [Portunus trituberculatus]|uniref:CCHC-type domain-containing protein n=1 Tax=Portunus trituberculatus TaxID=210409 RepID=A0A5B7F336_PORTR|nr:hypothetical protein [Portunus trituberculatus]
MSSNKKTQKLHRSSDSSRNLISTVKCHNCGEGGHIRPRCPKNPRAFNRDGTSTLTVGFCLGDKEVSKSTYCVAGTINGSSTSTVLRDTGCSSLVVSEEALPDVTVYDYVGRADQFPVVKCYLTCPYCDGWADDVRAPIKFATVLLGDFPGTRKPDDPAYPLPAHPLPAHVISVSPSQGNGAAAALTQPNVVS